VASSRGGVRRAGGGGSAPDDLFGAAARSALDRSGPLAARLRPRNLDEIIGQLHLVAPGAPLRSLVEQDRVTSAVLWGPPGSGKTTLALAIASHSSKEFVTLHAVSAGVADVRAAIGAARDRLGEQGRGTILFIDEVHRFNRAQQDALLPSVEEGLVVLIGATTENPYFSVNSPLLSRSTLWRLYALTDEEIRAVVRRGLAAEGSEADDGAIDELVSVADGDARAALGTLEIAIAISRTAGREVETADVERARAGRLIHHGRDAHYDMVSALIKSVRGSDPDAGLYWLARMLEAGSDPRFVARRLVILASEDVGLADPTALLVADAAARAVEFVGLPEAQLNLAEAVIYLAVAPKSNTVTSALGRALEDARRGPRADVPEHLRDSHYPGARALGHGAGYVYPHNEPQGWVKQEYRPPEVAQNVYYEPTDHGAEAVLAARLEQLTSGVGESPEEFPLEEREKSNPVDGMNRSRR
jgi:putative ATPase